MDLNMVSKEAKILGLLLNSSVQPSKDYLQWELHQPAA
jgi:hypothetical protein